MFQRFKTLFFKPKDMSKAREEYPKILRDVRMRNNEYYQEDCAAAALRSDLDKVGGTLADFKRWYEEREE